jgi:general L-amino acid transport system permease protein
MTQIQITKVVDRKRPTLNVLVTTTPTNWWRYYLVQSLIVLFLIGIICFLISVIHQGLARLGISFSFAYLVKQAGIEISEGKTISFVGIVPHLTNYSSSDTNLQALVTGLYNTIKITILSILISTLLGVLLGISRLSTNWVIRQCSFVIIEFVRNTPLLIQVVFWYFAVILQFPPLASAIHLFGWIITQQGTFFPLPEFSEGSSAAAQISLIISTTMALISIFAPIRFRLLCTMSAAIAFATCIFLGFPMVVDYPIANKFRVSGGGEISAEMAAILLAIAVNSGAYIAEIVRGAIVTVDKGQWEAAAAMGLSKKDTFRDVILPNVFRVVLPSFGNVYINLAKNTAMGIAIGFPDLFNVYGTTSNQTGRMLEGMLIVTATYLLLSWSISIVVNAVNANLAKHGGAK